MDCLVFLSLLLSLGLTQAQTDAQPQTPPEPEFLPTPTEVSVQEGDTAVLRCSVRNLGRRMVVWKRASDPWPITFGTTIFEADVEVEHQLQSPHVSDWNLVLRGVTKENAGDYKCQISPSLIRRVRLSVLDALPRTPPVILSTPTEVSVQEGGTAVLLCSVRNLGPKMVIWRRESENSPLTMGTVTYVDDPDVEVEHELQSPHVSDWNLVLKDVSKEDAGVYECQIYPSSSLTRRVWLYVLDARPQLPVPEFLPTPTEVSVHEGDTAVLQCSVRNPGPKRVSWVDSTGWNVMLTFATDVEVQYQQQSAHVSDWNLVLTDVSKDDEGVYECQFDNLTRTVRLSVLDAEVPNEPSG